MPPRRDSVQEKSAEKQKWVSNWLQKIQAVLRLISCGRVENVVFIPKSSNQYYS